MWNAYWKSIFFFHFVLLNYCSLRNGAVASRALIWFWFEPKRNKRRKVQKNKHGTILYATKNFRPSGILWPKHRTNQNQMLLFFYSTGCDVTNLFLLFIIFTSVLQFFFLLFNGSYLLAFKKRFGIRIYKKSIK